MRFEPYQPASHDIVDSLLREVRLLRSSTEKKTSTPIRQRWNFPASDQSFDLLAEAEQFSAHTPGWDRQGLIAAARCSLEDGATLERVTILYGAEIAAEVSR